MALSVGIHSIPADEYHADTCHRDRPSLSASIAKILVTQSPLHAWAAHPKLNPDYEPDDRRTFDIGRTIHSLILEGHTDMLEVIDADSYRTKVAQEARDEAYAVGRTPLLVGELPRVTAMAQAIRTQIDQHKADPPLFSDGKAEQTLVWEEDGVLCRARLDWLRDDFAAIDDLKSVSRSAKSETWQRATCFPNGYDVQAAMYMRAVRAITGASAQFRFVVVETTPPYAISVNALAPDALALAEAKLDYAVETWRRCLAEDAWPGYPREIVYLNAPGWAEAQWLEKEAQEAMV